MFKFLNTLNEYSNEYMFKTLDRGFAVGKRYSDYLMDIRKCAYQLENCMGQICGMHIGVISHSCYEYLVLLGAIIFSRGVAVPINEKESDYLNSLGLTSREKDSYFNTSNQIYQIKNDYKDRIANATDEEKTNLNVQKKTNIINSIKNSGLTNEAKAYLYDKSYGDTDVLNALTDLNVNMNAYLDLEAQNFTYDKYVNGKSAPNSKKRKVFNYINSMNIPYEQKLILAKLKYASYNDNNYEIIRYLDNSPLDYNSKIQLFKKMGFKVSADGKVSWK